MDASITAACRASIGLIDEKVPADPFRAARLGSLRAEMCRARTSHPMPQHESANPPARANPLCACGCVPAGLSLIEAAKARRQRRRDAARRRLGAACAADDAREVRLAIDGGADVTAACFRAGGEVDELAEGFTAAYVAAYSGAVDVMRYLLDECAADPNAGGECGSTPLHGAGASGAADCIRLCAAHDPIPLLPVVCI